MCGKASQRYERAFSLPELSMAIAVSGVILTALLSFTVYAAKSFAAIENYVDLEQKSQIAIDTMTQNIRQTQRLTSYASKQFNGKTITNVLTFLDSNNQDLSYHFTNNILLQTKGGANTVLLTNVDYLCFQVFQRNTQPSQTNSYDQFPTSTASLCKLISVSWICSRTILGSRLNTESVQTAKIVIRKQ